ncbi:MAG: energy-coupling factor transporter transmembrane component T family protein, partial [Candidatus Adiutrix sp.]
MQFEASTSQGQSIMHRTDPRLKIVSAIIWSFAVATLPFVPQALWALGGAMVLAALGRLSPFLILKRLLFVNIFIVFMWFFLPFSFSSPGEVVASWGFFKITKEGLTLAALITIKANG